MQGELRNLCMKSVFITGSNRGIGFEFVKQLTRLQNPPKHIFAACRNPSAAKELQELASQTKTIHVIQLDVQQYEKLQDVVELVTNTLAGDGLNLLINNAGILNGETRTFDTVTPEAMREHYETNTIAPLMICKALQPLLKQAAAKASGDDFSCSRAAIMNISSKVGSVADNQSGASYPYRCSKSSLNILTKSLSIDLKGDGILACVLHPGWVLTDMGGSQALTETKASVEGLLKVMAAFNETTNGSFYDFRGNEIPW